LSAAHTRAGLLDWLKQKVLAEGKIHPEEPDLITLSDDPAEVLRIIKKAHAEAGFDAPVTDADGT
jgi:hypothetical protein